MFRKLIVLFALAALAGCSFISIESPGGTMERVTNYRYGYKLWIPEPWSRRANSHVRPTKLDATHPEDDAAIIVYVKEGGELPGINRFEQSSRHKETEKFAVIRKWHEYFDDVTGYVTIFTWKGTVKILGLAEFGKPGVQYKAKLAVINREPSPLFLLCYAEAGKFEQLNQEFFGDTYNSFKVTPVELTVREARRRD